MRQSSTLDVGLDVHQEAITVAYVAKAHDAEVVYQGTKGNPEGHTLQKRSRAFLPSP
jgi:hypothetical protein